MPHPLPPFTKIPATPLLGVETVGMARRVPGWAAPMVWFLLIAALLAMGPEGHPALRLSLLPLLPASLGASVAMAAAWRTLMRHAPIRRVLPLVAILMLVPIQFLSGWDGVHDGVIVILPLSWAALQGNRRDVVWGVLAAAVVCFAGPVVGGYIPPSAVFDALTIAVWAIAALTLNSVVVRARRQARELTITFTDMLTGLPNRRGWDDLLAAALGASSDARSPLTVLLLDRDDFSDYNDDWGHGAGDRELVITSAAWHHGLRHHDVMARVGADEFAIALPGSTMADADALVARLQAATAPDRSFAAGAAQWDGSESGSDLSTRCAGALAEAKLRRRVVGGPRLVRADRAQQTWELVLPRLVAEEAVESVYQPIVRLADRAIVAYEALARPTGAGADLQVDGMFITARTLGISAELEMLCVRAAVIGSRSLPADADLFVNVGAGALHHPDDFIADLGALLARVGREPSTVILEISESVTKIGRFAAATAALRRAGFRLALDDAGEGHSAIASLAAVRPAFIKLGRSLTTSHTDPGSASTIHALVQFAKFAGGSVIAEGIEQVDDCDYLQVLGVEFGQGFALGRPQRIAGVMEWEASLVA